MSQAGKFKLKSILFKSIKFISICLATQVQFDSFILVTLFFMVKTSAELGFEIEEPEEIFNLTVQKTFSA